MTDKELAIYIGTKIKEYRLQRGLTQKELATLVDMGDTTIANYEKGFRTPKKNTLFKISSALSVTIDDLFPPIRKADTPTASPDSLTQQINDKLVQLTPDNKKIVLRTSEELLERQKANGEMYTEQNEEETKKNEVSEVISLYQVEVVSETAAASGFNYGFGYDDTDREIIEVDEQPPHHDIATKVSGDSMQPDYQDGDILYLVDKGLTTYNGDLAVIAYGDRSYFKKIYTENGRLRLVSLNDKYEDIILDFPPAEDTHIKIYAVVGVYRGGATY
ncbi:helix-turn-helix domain-containing protein [Streptococcus pseudopneumoniae]|uniref:XRE family transcriptional regulator n=1 Tax=Streptococcus pseudopneumoniae TaxID=257758 RepID=UPI0018B0EB00|nr:S24 family peptidase [Streptococcus pseudopneumoniae]MBF9651946.1 helix-turn-helix domain-containing protein [Streptococcus pseudopneumoniae]